jgi:flagellar basal body-associated protein FliL
MGDDTPLAFAAPTLNAIPGAPAVTTTPNTTKFEPMPSASSSYLPPVPPAPTNSTTTPDAKPKKKSKVLLVVLGIFALAGVLGGGIWGYYRYAQKNEIALVTGCAKKCGNDDACIEACYIGTAVVLDKKPGLSQSGPAASKKPLKQQQEEAEEAQQTTQFQQVSNQVNQQLVNDEKNIAQNVVKVGGSCNGLPEGTACDNGSGVCTGGNCVASNAKIKALCGTLFAEKQTGKVSAANQLADPCKNGTCTLTPELQAAGCIVQRVTCKAGGQSGVACEETIAKTITSAGAISVDNTAKCGSEQIDVICKELCKTTQPLSFANRITGINCSGVKQTTTTNEDVPPSTPPNTPVLACTGLTQTPATASPALGSVLTFTCAGTVTPAGATALTYKFRYSLNDGADQLMTNVTANTARLTISTCGTYSVQCKVCGTIGGVQKCDPIWQGAVQ